MDSGKKRYESQTAVIKIIGWILFLSSFPIMLLDYQDGRITAMFWIGCAMTPIGIVSLMIAKRRQKRRISPPSDKGNPLLTDEKRTKSI
ncbi:MAG: hypothetical protein ACMUIA_10520 [bacterium]